MAEIKNITISRDGDMNRFSADFEGGGQKANIWFRTKEEVNPIADVFVACALVPCMRMREDLSLDGPISARLSGSIGRINDIMLGWYPSEMKRVLLRGSIPETRVKADGKKVACFFTGGVDSFYTLLKHLHEIDTIVYVHGFDLWLHEEEFRKSTSARIRDMAAKLGKELIEVETNLLYFSHKVCDWPSQYYGSALASVALLLSKTIGKMYIASSLNTEVLYARGSHPDLDFLWNTEEIEIVHDGCESTRLGKVMAISKNDVALDNIRVCLDRRWGKYNCSKCEKCVRTMLSLHISGALEKSGTFEHALTPELISSLGMTSNSLIFARENYAALSDGPLKDALGKKIKEYEHA